jgi:hypothetical protein
VAPESTGCVSSQEAWTKEEARTKDEQAMTTEQPSLLSHGLAPLQLRDRVRIHATGQTGEVCQTWHARERYTIYLDIVDRPMDKALPAFQRDELELIEDEVTQ